VKAKRKMLVFTDKGFYDRFKKDTDGLLSEDIEIELIPVN